MDNGYSAGDSDKSLKHSPVKRIPGDQGSPPKERSRKIEINVDTVGPLLLG